MTIVEITDASEKARICAQVIRTLPDWFGQPAANARYVHEIADKIAFGALQNGNPIGLLALKVHFTATAELWWLGIEPEFHRRGCGRALVQAALQRAHDMGCADVVVSTVSARSSDVYYARTRAFYIAMGFRPLVEFNEEDPANPMVWMVRGIL